MKKELVEELFQKFEHACYFLEGVECWSAREMQEIFNYTEWRNFLKVVDKAKISCENSGESVPDHFVEVNKMVSIGSKAERRFEKKQRKQKSKMLVRLKSPLERGFRGV